MRHFRDFCRITAFAGVVAVCGPAAWAADAGISVELNKLEPSGGACRSYLVIDNALARKFDALALDLVVFDTDAIIARRLAVDLAPLAAERTVVKAFDLDGLACDAVGRVLLNGVLSCSGEGVAAGEDCRALIAPGSRAAVPFDG